MKSRLACVVAALGAVALSFLVAGAASAEEKEIVPAQIAGIPFGKYVQTPGYLNSLRQTVQDYEARFGDCDKAKYDARMQIGQPQKPISFPDVGEVPQWIEIVRVEGCKDPYIRGVLVALIKDRVSFHPLLKGDGVSGVFAQQRVIGKMLLQEKAVAMKAGCGEKDKIRIFQHDMVDKTKTDTSGDWDEVWHINNCKGVKFVQVTFKNDGADFSMQDVEVKKN